MNHVLVIVVSTFAALSVGAVALFVYWGMLSREDSRQAELARRLGTATPETDDTLFRNVQDDATLDTMGSLGLWLQGLLLEAGEPYDMQGLLARCMGASAIGFIALVVLTRGPLGILGVIFGVVPVLILNSQASARARLLSEQLPDALDLVSRSLQAGHGLADAMSLCAEEMPSPVADEFGRVFEENQLGRDLRTSFNTLSDRNPRNFDLKLFVSSVLLQRDTGGNLIEILGNISKTIRDRFVFEAKVRALTAEARISAIILGGLPFAILAIISVLRPDYLRPLIDDPLGHYVVAGALTWFAIGVFVMRTVSDVEV